MDGEHVFSAALVLVMANVAFPPNDRDQSAMEQALKILQSMANKGNEYIRARHALLLNLRNNLGNSDTNLAAVVHGGSASMNGLHSASGQIPGPDTALDQFRDLSFNLDMEDADTFWDDFSGDDHIDMSSGWLANAFQHGSASQIDETI